MNRGRIGQSGAARSAGWGVSDGIQPVVRGGFIVDGWQTDSPERRMLGWAKEQNIALVHI